MVALDGIRDLLAAWDGSLKLLAGVAIFYSPFLILLITMALVTVLSGGLREQRLEDIPGAEPAKLRERDLATLAVLLGKMNLFKGLTDPELRMVAAIGKRQLVRDGDSLTSAGNRAADLYTIFEGRLKVLTQSGDGDTEETATRVAGPRETVPLAAISVAQTFDTSVKAAVDCELFVIPRDRLVELCDQQPAIRARVYGAIAQAFEERYRHTLDSLAESLKTVLKLAPNTE